MNDEEIYTALHLMGYYNFELKHIKQSLESGACQFVMLDLFQEWKRMWGGLDKEILPYLEKVCLEGRDD